MIDRETVPARDPAPKRAPAPAGEPAPPSASPLLDDAAFENDPIPHRARAERPRRISLAAVVLGLDGGVLAMYGGVLPLLPFVVEEPVPDVAVLVGIVAIVTAVWIWRLSRRARWVAVALLAMFLVRDVAFAAWRISTGTGWDLAGWAADSAWVAVDAFALFVLVRRWPPPS